MKINKVHCLFEQSGTFKNEFKKLGIPAEDYDIQNNFGETDHVIDLFAEIDAAYRGGCSMFDNITKDDLIIAFYPCIYFCQMSQYMQSLNSVNYRCLSEADALKKIIERQNNRNDYLVRLTKFTWLCVSREIKMVFENPITDSFLNHYFLKPPTIKDMDRTKKGDYFKKPTGYWFWNFEPKNGFTWQQDKEQKLISECKASEQAGLCSEERSMISPDYARNWIKSYILGEDDYSHFPLFEGIC